MDTSKKAYVIAIIIQLIYAGMFVVSKAAFDHGLSTYVFVFYRQFAGSLLWLSLAFFLRRKNAGSVPPRVFLKLFLCAFLGITFAINLYSVCLKFTSATVASATDNSMPVITFFVALLLRMEDVKLRTWSGLAKLAGVALSLAGVLVIAFYAGPSLSPVNHHRAFPSHASSAAAAPPVARGASWVKWTLLMVVANVTWSLWIVIQAAVLKECPDKILVTTTQCVFGTVQSFAVAVVAERDFSRWKLHFDVSLLSILYNGFVGIGACYYLQAWCFEMKGPVFQIFWTPLCFVFTIFCSSFFLGEMVHLGSIVGGILLVGGLYCVIWGKSKEPMVAPDSDDVNKNIPPQREHCDPADERKDKAERKPQGSASATAIVEEQV